MKIELLYFAGCPHYSPMRELVASALAELGVDAEVAEIDIVDQQDAERHRFLGSPTILVDGLDIEPDARSRTDYAMSCRLYGGSGLPPREMIEAAVTARRR